jgi:hypothetical protein
MMHGHEKSDSAIVAVKPTNKAEGSTAELAHCWRQTKPRQAMASLAVAAPIGGRGGKSPAQTSRLPVCSAVTAAFDPKQTWGVQCNRLAGPHG